MHSAMVRGIYDQVQITPGMTEANAEADVFLDSVMRTVRLKRTGSTEFMGFSVGKWGFHPDMWRSAAAVPANTGYFQNEEGLLNMTYAQGSPVYVSKVLFEDAKAAADTVTIDAPKEFMEPSRWKNEFLIEPWTGMFMGADVNMQIAFKTVDYVRDWTAITKCGDVKPPGCYDVPPVTVDGHPFSQGLATAYYPLLVLSQSVRFTEDTRSKIQSQVLGPIQAAQHMHSWGWIPLVIAGAAMSFVAVAILVRRRKQDMAARASTRVGFVHP